MHTGAQTVCVAVGQAFCKLKRTSVSCAVVNAANAAFLFPSISISMQLLNLSEYLSASSKLN